MTIQQIVDPGNVESELMRIWDGLAKEKVRACLFNLIVFNRISSRTDYFRNIVQKVSEKYPCRVLFISTDPDSHTPYLKTAVSVVGSGSIACDYIDIGVSGPDLQRVPFVVWPHIVPDLPVTLLWTEDPTKFHSLFEPLSKLASRVIFDSECADNLPAFSEKVLGLKGIDVADLNWARTEGWRDLIASLFHSQEKTIEEIKISYNASETEFFCHLKVQSLYLVNWLASRLHWHKKQKVKIEADKWEKLGPGTVISVDLTTEDGTHYACSRIPTQYHYVTIQIASQQQCELPYQFVLGKTATGQSLVKEIITKGTSVHYLDMLKHLKEKDGRY